MFLRPLFVFAFIVTRLIFALCLFFSGSTSFAGTVTDVDGNVYQTVIIGTQEWMAENLRTVHYRNGVPIPFVPGEVAWNSLLSGAYCQYDTSASGLLYNWFAVVDSGNLAPAGWHVPTDFEWKLLESSLGMGGAALDSIGWRGTNEGGKLKDTVKWHAPNLGATNATGFSALPAGFRPANFRDLGLDAYFWTASETTPENAWYRHLNYDYARTHRERESKRWGLSIRCVRDDTDGDGITDGIDEDDDNDGVADIADNSPLNPDLCADSDSDGCDDCAIGTDNFGPLADNLPALDGLDTDSDGLCDGGDSDDDNDGILDVADTDPANPFVCTDSDGDGCDDCAVGTDGFGPLADNAPANDGSDTDGDGKCDSGDPCPLDAQNDIDQDSICGNIDNCPSMANPTQADANGDGIGDACCCIGATGNVNAAGSETPDLSDLSLIISYLTITPRPVLPCPAEANVNQIGSIDLSDLSLLIAYLTQTPRPALPSCP